MGKVIQEKIVDMSRDGNKIESIAVNTVSQEIDGCDLLHPCLATNDKIPFFDGHILLYKEPKQANANYDGRIPVQIKGREVSRFSNDNRCSFSVTKSELNAFWKEGSVLFFVVEIHKHQKKAPQIYVRELLPFDIDEYNNRIGKNRQQSISIQLRQLKEGQLQLVCQNFLVNREKQAHKKVLPFANIKGIEFLNLSILHEPSDNNSDIWDEHLLAGNPLYLYAGDQNGFQIPIVNIQNAFVQLRSYDEVFVGNKSFGELYAKEVMSKDGHYLQFGESCKCLPNGEMKFSESGMLDDRIRDLDFIQRFLNGETICIGDTRFPYAIQRTADMEAITSTLRTCYEFLTTIKQVFEILGMKGPVDVTAFDDQALHRIFVYGKSISGGQCPVKFKNGSINVLRFGNYCFAVFYHQDEIINLFSKAFYESVSAVLKLKGKERQIPVSPYYLINAEYIAKSANFDGNVVMDSIRSMPYSLFAGPTYNNLLLESIKAMDISPTKECISGFANDLAEYLIENEDSLIYRLNKLQIKKRVGSLDTADTDWLLVESTQPHETKLLCGIAILLDNSQLFDEQFAKLSETEQEEFNGYPIMKLHNQVVL